MRPADSRQFEKARSEQERDMKQKFSIFRDEDRQALVIREYAELDKEILSMLCEETYEDAAIKTAIDEGEQSLVAALRTKNLYPPGVYARQIAAAVMELYETGSTEIRELNFNDLDLMISEQDEEEEAKNLDDETEDIDDLIEDDLDDDVEDDLDDKIEIKKINKSIKVADDEGNDVDIDG